MSGYQQVTIIGRVGRDPEMRYLPSGVPVTNFTVAVNRVFGTGEDRKEEVTWFRCAAWRQLAELVTKWVSKGREVCVIGTIKAHPYLDQSGLPQATLELTADRVIFLGDRGETEMVEDRPVEEPSDIEF